MAGHVTETYNEATLVKFFHTNPVGLQEGFIGNVLLFVSHKKQSCYVGPAKTYDGIYNFNISKYLYIIIYEKSTLRISAIICCFFVETFSVLSP